MTRGRMGVAPPRGRGYFQGMHPTRLVLALALFAVSCAPSTGTRSAAAAPAASPQPVDSALALATFDSVWLRIANTHYDSAYNGVDWDAVRAELRPRAAVAGTLPALRVILSDMLARLGESHFGIIPGDAAGVLDGGASAAAGVSGGVGMELRLIGDEVVVSHVDAGGAAARAGVRTGWIVREIDGVELAPRVAALHAIDGDRLRVARTRLLYQLNGRLSGATESELPIRFEDGAGQGRALSLVRQVVDGQVVKFGNLPPSIARLTHERIDVTGGRCAGVIRFNIWMVPLAPLFDRAMDELAACDGVVIDLRGNPGGVAGMVMGTAGHFFADTAQLGFMKLRTAEMRFKANPRRVRADGSRVDVYAGRVAILIDEMSASTSEIFAGALQAHGRARTFGSTSAGQALPAVLIRLPTDDVLMHVLADLTGPGGIRMEGAGVRADEAVPLRRDTLLEGRDAVLDAALRWIAGGTTPRTD
jgi:carboxyl-terminal processing protease